ncbi:hypothetical protein GEMRC1_008829 [Eukaryota sp. GEM-RC1]
MLFSYQLFIHICPIEFLSLEPPTRGGFVPLVAFNLGLDPIVIHHSTAWVNEGLDYYSNNHENLNMFFFEGHGCHEMMISRSTDSSIISFTYCFKKPVISFVSPYLFFLNGELSIIGHDLSTSFDYSSLVSEIASTRVANHSHEEIVHYIPYVCSVESNIFNVYVIIGNQTSNVVQLHLTAPRHDYFPFILSPAGNLLRLFGTNFGKMFECFDNSTIQMSGYASQLEQVTIDELTISTGEIAGLSQFITEIKFIPGISLVLYVPITSLEAYNTSLVCFVNHHCEIYVYSLNGEVSMDDFQITTSLPNSIQVFNFQAFSYVAHIEFISTVPGVVDDLELCSEAGCYPIFNLPYIVLPNSISPRLIQWFESSFVHEISLEVEGIHFYECSSIESSFIFGELMSQLIEVQDNIVIFEVLVVSDGSFASLGIDSFGSTFNLNLVFEVNNYLLIPPFVQINSRVEFILLEQISFMFISHGTQKMLLRTGSNVFELFNDDPFITLHQSTQSMNVSLITDLVADQLPFYYEIDLYQSFTVDFYQIDYSIDVECVTNCEILDHNSDQGSLSFTFFSLNQGESSFLFLVQYLETAFSFELVRQVVLPPSISFSSSVIFSTIDDVIVSISILSQCPLHSEFHVNTSIVYYDQMSSTFSEFLIFPYSSTYSFNISWFSFSLGESDLQWSWNHIGFENQIIGDIKVFNTEFTSSDHVSVYEHRDILVDFVGLLHSQFMCVVDDHIFVGSVSNSKLICKNLIISTFHVVVPVKVFFDGLLINSFSVYGEGFLEEICFLPTSNHPKIENSHYASNISNTLIFDGLRCCSVDVSFCSEFLKSSQSISVTFNSSFDIFYIVITTNSSCGDFDFDLPFVLLSNGQSHTSPFSCKQIPSGFSFALMCEIDNVIPKVEEIILIPRNDVFLLELEFYGYQSYTCITPVDINKGITSLGEEIEETIHLRMGNETYTNIEQFKNSISQSNQLINTPHITYFLHLASLNCFQATVPVTITFTPGEAVQLIVVQNYLEIDSCSLNISIPIICVDPIGFIVKCFGNLTIMSSTFNFTRFQLFTNELQFLSHQCFIFDYSRFEYEFSGQMFEANLTFIQKFAEILKVDTYDVLECSHQMLFEKSCTVLKPYVTLITQHHLSNTSSKIPLSALEFTSIDDHIVLVVFADSVEINSFPLQSMSISISFCLNQ